MARARTLTTDKGRRSLSKTPGFPRVQSDKGETIKRTKNSRNVREKKKLRRCALSPSSRQTELSGVNFPKIVSARRLCLTGNAKDMTSLEPSLILFRCFEEIPPSCSQRKCREMPIEAAGD
ncbi:hypothetical protein RRG08_016695 [Elysia crispata]|uniref:Uncharacterized protein n=1 Tax=Elysia crispata TaxID=231223 RepID=A0AAE1AK51_9GAST|nr:hypothetical protein RRG08_016695 [Elysia crispata]